MEKEFIPYEQALELKELGFNEPCYCFYNGKFLQWKIDDSEGTEAIDINPNKNIGLYISAPLYQQAFRFFREKYDLIGWVSSKTLDEGKTIYIPHGRTIPDTINKNLIVDIIPYVTLKTFEEAELECLKKLIEIVKEK